MEDEKSIKNVLYIVRDTMVHTSLDLAAESIIPGS